MTANGVTKEAQNKLEKSGINVTALEDAVRRGDAASIMKSVKCKNCSDSEENGADLDGGVAGSKNVLTSTVLVTKITKMQIRNTWVQLIN